MPFKKEQIMLKEVNLDSLKPMLKIGIEKCVLIKL